MALAAAAPPAPLRAVAEFPIVRGLVLALVGFGIGAAFIAIVRSALGDGAWDVQLSWTAGYIVALLGWLGGVGAWRYWGREWVGREAQPFTSRGWRRYFDFNSDHKVIGIQYTVTFIALFLLAGVAAMLMRAELADDGQQFIDNRDFNMTMSFHGIAMIAVAVAALLGGLGNYVMPLMIGAKDMAFPRLNALTYWLVPPVAVMLVLSVLIYGGWNSGWTAYPPLSVTNGPGQVLFNLAVITFGLVSIFGGLNFLATLLFERAPGMTWSRIPIFVWGVFAASLIAFFFTQAFAASLLMVLLDRLVPTGFFTNAAEGGGALLYEHTFWFYSHPAVYIMVLPGFGVALEILSHLSRKPLFAYRWAIAGLLGIVALSGIVWAHHMFTSGMNPTLHGPFLVMTELISIPTGLIFLAAVGTIWAGRLWLRTPMLFALGFVFNFLMGGITGIYLADIPTDLHLHDSYFVVAHFHYTIMGGEIFALFAGIYYWFPKMTGRQFNERLGRIHFWLMFIGFQLVFLPMFYLGVQGMNRRIGDYPATYDDVNLFVTISGFVLGISFLFFVANMVHSWVWGRRAAANPWGATTLEWALPSPPPEHNFPVQPRVTGTPYTYGNPEATPHAEVEGLAASPASGGD